MTLKRIIGVFVLAYLSCLPANSGAQTAITSSNTDILKMIQAGLPESVVVNKIREGTGRWDISIDALIALKQAGATEAELQALSVQPVATTLATSNMSPSLVTPQTGQPVLGGILKNDGGKVTFAVQGDPDGYRSQLFRLVVVNEQPALVAESMSQTNHGFKYGPYIYGEMLITKDSTTVFPYDMQLYGDSSRWLIAPDLTAISNPLGDVHFPKLGKNGPSYEWGNEFFHKGRPTPSRAFLDLLIQDFAGTLETLEKAAGISNLNQLSADSKFHPLSREEVIVRIDKKNRDLAADQKMSGVNTAQQIVREQQEAKLHPPTSSADGLTNVITAVQGVSNLEQAMKDAKTADLAHNTAGQVRAAVNGTSSTMQTLNAVSGNPTTMQQIAPLEPVTTIPTQKSVAAPRKSVFTLPPPKPLPTPPPTPSTGTVGPIQCVDLGPGNCMPLAQWEQLQSQKGQQTPGTVICPASGFIAGTGHYAACDEFIGERLSCTPGQSVPIPPPAVPPASCGPVASTGSGPATGGNGGSSFGSGSSGGGNTNGSSGSGGSTGSKPIDARLNYCIGAFYRNDPISGTVLTLQNNCTVTAKVYWYSNPTDTGGVLLNPGEVENTYNQQSDILASGGVTIYACPQGDMPLGANGVPAINGQANAFDCVRQ